MPRIHPDQLAEAIRTEQTTALPLSRLCAALAASGSERQAEEVRYSARSRPDLFFLLDPGSAWTGTGWTDDSLGEYTRALRESEPQVLLVEADARAPGSAPAVHTALLTLLGPDRSGADADAELVEAMRDAVELERILGDPRTD